MTTPTAHFTSVYDATLARFVVERGPCAWCAQGHAAVNGEHKLSNTIAPHGGANYRVEPCGVMRVVPSSDEMSRAVDPHGAKRAQQVCDTLNRVYASQGAPKP